MAMKVGRNTPIRSRLLLMSLLMVVISVGLILGSPAPIPAGDSLGNSTTIYGRGSAHGVGLSMSGVEAMARSGRNHQDILKKYYTGITASARSDLVPSKIKVGLVSTSGTVIVTANGNFDLYDYQTGSKLGSGSSGQSAKVYYSGGSYRYTLPGSSSEKVSSNPVRFRPATSSVIMEITSLTRMSNSRNANQFRGDIVARYSANSGSLWAINELSMNEYLYGLAEEPNDWPTEAQRTLAVASRTYAVEKARNSDTAWKKDNYDICWSSSCQYYLGYLAERPNFRSAVDHTNNMVITHPSAANGVIVAAYHGNSGGHTEHNENVWVGATPLPYLRGVSDPDSPGTIWTKTYTNSELQALLNKDSRTKVYGDLKGFTIDTKGVSGRVVYLTVLGSEGNHSGITGTTLRGVLGLSSTWFWFSEGDPVLTTNYVHPNPFTPNFDKVNDTQGFVYTLARSANVIVKVYNYKGLVRTMYAAPYHSNGLLYNRYLPPGVQTVGWTGTNDLGKVLPPGNYRYEIIARNGPDSTVGTGITAVQP